MRSLCYIGPSGIGPSGIGPSGIGPSGIGASGISPSGIGPSGIGPSGIDLAAGGWVGMGLAHQEARAAHRQHNVHLARSSEHATPRPVLAEPCRELFRAVPALSARAPPCAPPYCGGPPSVQRLRHLTGSRAISSASRNTASISKASPAGHAVRGGPARGRACKRMCGRAGGRCVGGLHMDSMWSSAEPRMSLVLYGASTIWAVSKLPRHSLLRTDETTCTVEAFSGRSSGAVPARCAFPADARGAACARSHTFSTISNPNSVLCAPPAASPATRA
jgi:hypothetical protein